MLCGLNLLSFIVYYSTCCVVFLCIQQYTLFLILLISIHIIRSVYALNGGVKRAHLVSPSRGAILKELYTRDGSGMLISRDIYEGIRPAQPADLRSIEDLIAPLVADDILVARSRGQLEKDMPDTFVLSRDGKSNLSIESKYLLLTPIPLSDFTISFYFISLTIGTTLAIGMLKKYDYYAEICCLAVDPRYRKVGRGETMLAYLERRALMMGLSTVFVLSTHTMQWFEERGFILSDPKLLPPSRFYNAARASKVYIKQLGSQRDVDAEELLWNVQ